MSALGSFLVAQVFLHALAGLEIDGVAGLTVGADPIVSGIALLSGLRGRPLDGLIVRKQPKEHGTGRRIEGPWREGLRLAIVDDTLTTGRSALDAASAVADEGGCIAGVYSLIDRAQGAREAIESAGYAYTAIFAATEIVDPG